MVLSMGRAQGGHLWEPLSAWSLGVIPEGTSALTRGQLQTWLRETARIKAGQSDTRLS